MDNNRADRLIKEIHDLSRVLKSLNENVVTLGRKFMSPCTCPWNNGYVPIQLMGHHLHCPALTGEHSAEDDCGFNGHRSKTVIVNDPPIIKEQ